MDIRKFLKKAISNGRTTLTEKESKQLLNGYDVPVISETVAKNVEEAIRQAENIGFPVVLKGLGTALLHKTEQGLVHLNIANPDAVKKAVGDIKQRAGDALDGILVQPLVEGKREFVAGLFQDHQFGPVIMFGIGGILTEAIADVSFRLAPLTETDAVEMINEIRAQKLLDRFRGEKAVDKAQLTRALMGLSKIGIDFPEVTEIDINPLLISPDGAVRAVDALVVLSRNDKKIKFQPPIDPKWIGSLFYPESIAFIGASAQMGKWGNMLLSNTISNGFKGKIFPVNPKGGTIAGKRVYPTVASLPDHVDLGVVTVPASKVMALFPEFKKKKIRNMLLITSGFGETGKTGKQEEKALALQARESGVLVLGPNTMGITNPHNDLCCIGSSVSPRPGSTAIVSQSGNMGVQLLAFAEAQGIGIRAFCGSGNEAMITIEDYLDGFEMDTLTRTVVLYIESVKNGRRFFEGARKVGQKKPIILLKGGQSKAGNRAASTHTGALTSDTKVFNAVCKQAGIVKVEHTMDLLDLAAAFSSLPFPKGNRTAIMTLGGGWGVITADLCSKYNLQVPDLSMDLVRKIDQKLPSYWSRANPIDLVGEHDTTLPLFVIEELLKWDGCDAVINLGILGRKIFARKMVDSIIKADPTASSEFLEEVNRQMAVYEAHYIEQLARFMEKYQKPILGVSLLAGPGDHTVYTIEKSPYKSVFYPSPERAVKALSRMVEYVRFLNR